MDQHKSCRGAYRRIERRNGETGVKKRRIKRIEVCRIDGDRPGLTGFRYSIDANDIFLIVWGDERSVRHIDQTYFVFSDREHLVRG